MGQMSRFDDDRRRDDYHHHSRHRDERDDRRRHDDDRRHDDRHARSAPPVAQPPINPGRLAMIEQAQRQDSRRQRSPPRGHRRERSPSPQFAQRSRVPLPDQSQAMMAQNSERRANDLHRKSANRGRNRDFANEAPPAIFSVHRGEVKNIQSFGAFVQMEGFSKHGLVHVSQMADFRVEDPNTVVNKGDQVWVKVMNIDEDGKIALSMRYCDQSNGKDLDADHELAKEEQKRGKPMPKERKPLQLEAIVNTVCSRCGRHGHIKADCWNDQNQGCVNDDIIILCFLML